jgi:hypothetical protein
MQIRLAAAHPRTVWTSLASLDRFSGRFVPSLRGLLEILLVGGVLLGLTLSGTLPLSAVVWFLCHASTFCNLDSYGRRLNEHSISA